MMSALVLLAAATAGFLAWGFVEYLVHGILSHRYRTFVSPLHLGHHREPRAVFTSPIAWVPAALAIFGGLALATNPGLAASAVGGLLMGFGRYEYVHWRIHFREPRSARERRLRSHHLAHHFRNPRAYHGVTTRLWDRVFGTLPERWREDYARVEARAPLEGPSNFRWCYAPSGALRELIQVWRRLRARMAGARRGPGALAR
jgi:sterol desaturase/sphingolipid hydroxylase (fatty acid hydroxylase superfamily)